MSEASLQKTPSPLRFRLANSFFMSFGMSVLVVAVAVAVNTGFDSGLLKRWFSAWSIAFPVAWFAAFLWGPTARRLASMIVTPPPQS